MLTVLGPKEPPTLANLSWWITRGKRATDRRGVEIGMMAEASEHGCHRHGVRPLYPSPQ